ncbi:hypothetical protein J4558_19400 [Leptolyngbya sp. 15MV]|nr:hypothetical protein J4558_19400 [Leptolyngbya sp. 15MV]
MSTPSTRAWRGSVPPTRPRAKHAAANLWARRLPNSPSDADWLAAAARLAARGRPLSRPNPAVGCMIVNSGRVVGRGWTGQGGRPHAEAIALAQAGSAARGSTAYVTLERRGGRRR